MARVAYTVVLWLALPFVLLRLLWRSRRQPEYRAHLAERFGRHAGTPARPLIWLHAVSVGETRAAAPLVKALRQRYPDHTLLLTHTTPTGRRASEALFGAQVQRAYLPFDLPYSVARFFDHFRPALGVIMETELWPNLLHAAHTRGIPVALVNARLSERSARRYARVAPLAPLARKTLARLGAVAAQTQADAARLQALGARAVSVAGNMKFDVALPAQTDQIATLFGALGSDTLPILLFSSTRDGEEEIILNAVYGALSKTARLIIVPRHPQRFDEVAALLDRRSIAYQRRSTGAPLRADTRVLLGDSMGEMFAYYAASDVAFVAGSLLPLGGQNLLEACAMGKPVIVGPHTFNFEEATRLAIEAGAALRVHNADELAHTAARLLGDAPLRQQMGEAGRAFVRAHQGATLRVLTLIEALLGK